jgi:chemotaxis protein CheD
MSARSTSPARRHPSRTAARGFPTYFDRGLNHPAAKVMPGAFLVTGDDVALSTLLGSCVAACIRDPLRRIGGMNHFLLPGDPDKPLLDDDDGAPGRYGVFAMELLINALLKRGARRESLEAKVFGGGQVMRSVSAVGVGARNADFVVSFLAAEGIPLLSSDLRGDCARRVAFFPVSGRVLCRQLERIEPAALAEEDRYRATLAARLPTGEVELF